MPPKLEEDRLSGPWGAPPLAGESAHVAGRPQAREFENHLHPPPGGPRPPGATKGIRTGAQPLPAHAPSSGSHTGAIAMRTNSEAQACAHAASAAATAAATPLSTHPLEDPDLQGPHKAFRQGLSPCPPMRPRPASARRGTHAHDLANDRVRHCLRFSE